ncbi:MAG: hypothetical protein Ta2F_00310 [Termitinemataceae bacterium]|nr:MAG: hypothetical protein Ta2F_00310 [Termitinemataceae bacterium]
MKTEKNYKNVRKSFLLFVASIAACILVTACPSSDGSVEQSAGGSGGSSKKYDPQTPYPITIVAKLAQFIDETGEGSGVETLQLVDFPQEITAPVPTTSVAAAKQGTSVTVTIPALADHAVDAGLTKVVAENGSNIPLSASNKFTMPEGPVAVTIVYINASDVLKSPSYYTNELYSLDFSNGSVDLNLPNPITKSFPDDDNNKYYGAYIAYSGYPTVNITPLPVNSYAGSSWTFATSSWTDTTDNSLSTTSDDPPVEYFLINVKVIPQVKVRYPSGLTGVSDADKNATVIGTGKTVQQMYEQAVENVYHFRVVRAVPTVDARLVSVNISGVNEIYTKTIEGSQEKLVAAVAPYGTSQTDYNPVQFYAYPPFGSSEVSVVVETNDPGSRVKIDNGTFTMGSAYGDVTYKGGESEAEFTVTVQAEDDTKTKVYTISLANLPSTYDPKAKGGTTYFDETKVGNTTTVTEIHTFYLSSKDTIETGGQKAWTLEFNPENRPSTVEILLVGGGGAGGNFISGRKDSKTGSGGAGGVIYTKTFAITDNKYTVKVGAGGGSGLAKGVNDTFTLSGLDLPIAAAQKGGDSSFVSLTNPNVNKLVAPGGGGGANNSDQTKLYGGSGGSSGGSTEGDPRGDNAGSQSMPDLYTPLLDFYYNLASRQPDGTVDENFRPKTGMAWGNTGVVRTHRSGDLKHCSWAGGGAGSSPSTSTRTGYGQAGTDWGRGIKIDITGTEREYARSHLSGQGTPTVGAPQTGNGGGGGGGVNGAPGGSGIVVVKWTHSVITGGTD